MALGRLIKQTEALLPVFGRGLLARGNDPYHVTCPDPPDFVAGPDAVLLRDCLRNRHLIL